VLLEKSMYILMSLIEIFLRGSQKRLLYFASYELKMMLLFVQIACFEQKILSPLSKFRKPYSSRALLSFSTFCLPALIALAQGNKELEKNPMSLSLFCLP
jgi:hypothetical protein